MPMMTRRSYLALSAAAALLPRAGFAAQRVSLGTAELVTLSDGNLNLPPEFIFGPAPQDDLASLATEMGLDLSAPLTPPCNVTPPADKVSAPSCSTAARGRHFKRAPVG
jgi:hypothetical protein